MEAEIVVKIVGNDPDYEAGDAICVIEEAIYNNVKWITHAEVVESDLVLGRIAKRIVMYTLDGRAFDELSPELQKEIGCASLYKDVLTWAEESPREAIARSFAALYESEKGTSFDPESPAESFTTEFTDFASVLTDEFPEIADEIERRRDG